MLQAEIRKPITLDERKAGISGKFRVKWVYSLDGKPLNLDEYIADGWDVKGNKKAP